MSTVDNVKIVRQAKIAADNEGNKNHKLDTIEEVSLFADKLEEKGISNARKIINGYNTNPVFFETKFQLNGTGKDDSVEAAIASALNKNSYANNAELIKEEANDIVNGIKDGIGESWFFGLFNDYDKLNQKVGAINHENVLEVLNADYNGSGSNIIAGIANFANQEHLDTYGKTIITALVNLAKTKGIDVSDIVEEEGDKFSVGTAISGIEVGSSPTDKKYIEKVIYTLKERIENSMKMITDPEKAQDDLSATFATLLNANDRNQNGYIDGEEIFAFKAWCAKLGISANEMIMNINEKIENNEELTEEEKTLKAIFDSENSLGKTNSNNQRQNAIVARINKGIKNEDHALLSQMFAFITKDNVEEILSKVDNNENIGTTLVNKFGSDANNLNRSIIDALVAKAEELEIDVRDIVRLNNFNQYIAGSKVGALGENALEKENVNKVIQLLRKRIEEETAI